MKATIATVVVFLLALSAVAAPVEGDLDLGDLNNSLTDDERGGRLPGTRTFHSLPSGRSYWLYTPFTWKGEGSPLVVNIHPWFSTPMYQAVMSYMDLVAEERGFLVAYPVGFYRSFSAGPNCCFPAYPFRDDVSFIRELVAHLGEERGVDLRRVYSTGMSNGHYMSYRLACDASDVFAAIAGTAGSNPFPTPMTERCSPVHPMPMLHFHGTLDDTVSYSDAVATFEDWLELNGCDRSTEEVSFQGGDTTCKSFSNCTPQWNSVATNATFCSTAGATHSHWPSSPLFGADGGTYDLDASRQMLDFFERYSLEE